MKYLEFVRSSNPDGPPRNGNICGLNVFPKVRGHTRDLVELVRLETGLSHASSQSVVQTVLGYVCANFQRLDRQDLYFY